MNRLNIFILIAVIATCTFSSLAAESAMEERLGQVLRRASAARAQSNPLTINVLEVSTLLLEEALALAPNNVEHWRFAFDLASLSENEELKNRAVQKLNQLVPDDEWIRLIRLNSAINQFQTVQDRIAAYDRLLSGENIPRLGNAVASRLSLDLALIYQRQSDVEDFARQLAHAMALDSSNRAAAAIAAGYFKSRVDDPFGEAEMLVNLMMADPTNVLTQFTLAQLLLENGAYRAAERIYDLAIRSSKAQRRQSSSNVLVDYAIAQWASGRDDDALETIRKRQSELNTTFRVSEREKNPALTRSELMKLEAPAHPGLATVRAIILMRRGNQDAAAGAVAAYQESISLLKDLANAPDPSDVAQYHLESAWIAVWLGNEMDQVVELLAAAEEYQAITEIATKRFEGWMAYRDNDFEAAIELLREIAGQDTPAQLGLALALRSNGQKKEAAREFLDVNRSQPGSLIGIWAAQQLTDLLGSQIPLSDTATKLEELIRSIPLIYDRYADDSSLAVSLRLRPVNVTLNPFEPILLEIEIANNAVIPLALDRDGPIRRQVIIIPEISSAFSEQPQETRPITVNIPGRIRLQQREKYVTTIDLRNYHIAEVLDTHVLNGGTIKLTGLINFAVLPNGLTEPRLLGSEVDSPLVRVEGVRVNTDWIEESIELLHDYSSPKLTVRMGLLSHQVAPRIMPGFPDEERNLIEAARTALNEAFSRLDAISQAWLLSVIPTRRGQPAEGMQQILSMARKSDHRLVQMSYLLFHVTGADDPMLDAAERGDDPSLRRLAEDIRAVSENRVQAPSRN